MTTRTPFVTDAESNEFYVQLKYSGIEQLVAFTDGLPLQKFKGSTLVYIRIKDAITWYEKEIEYYEKQGKPPQERHVRVLKALQTALTRLEAGEAVVVDYVD